MFLNFCGFANIVIKFLFDYWSWKLIRKWSRMAKISLKEKKKDRQRELYYLVALRNCHKDNGKDKENFKADQNFVIDLGILEWRISTTQSSWLGQSLGQK